MTTFAGSDAPGVCQPKFVKGGLVEETVCGKKSVTSRCSIWNVDVTCPECLVLIAAGRALVAERNAVGK